jgi:hypothetical protein
VFVRIEGLSAKKALNFVDPVLDAVFLDLPPHSRIIDVAAPDPPLRRFFLRQRSQEKQK